jgi:hypothetical protein
MKPDLVKKVLDEILAYFAHLMFQLFVPITIPPRLWCVSAWR